MATRTVSTAAQLTAALDAASSGDRIVLGDSDCARAGETTPATQTAATAQTPKRMCSSSPPRGGSDLRTDLVRGRGG